MNWRKCIAACILVSSGTLLAQNKPATIDHSSLMNIELPSGALLDPRIFYIALAKTTLELEATPREVNISEVEVLSFINLSGDKEDARHWIDKVEASLSAKRYIISPSDSDPSFSWLWKDGSYYLMYASAGKKEASVYFGVADKWPGGFHPLNPPEVSSVPQTVNDHNTSRLVGEWGNLVGAKVNWKDESTGYMLVSGVSKGYGLGLKADGTYLHTMVVTSGRPNYRVFVSTQGNWSVPGDQIIFIPGDRHYQKWENEIIMIDEHTVPEQYSMFWILGSNEITGKECLYIKYDLQQEKWDELCKE